MGQECCSQRRHEQSSIGLMNGISYRKSIQEVNRRISQRYEEQIIQNIQEYQEDNKQENQEEQIDNLNKIPLFQVVKSELNIPIDEQQVIEKEKTVEQNLEQQRNQNQKEEQDVNNKQEIIEKANQENKQEILVKQTTVASKQMEDEFIDQILIKNKLQSEQLSFSNSYDTVTQSSQSKIEQILKSKQKPGKLNSIFLRALERKILGITVQKEQKEEQVITILDRPIPKVRPRKFQQPIEF